MKKIFLFVCAFALVSCGCDKEPVVAPIVPSEEEDDSPNDDSPDPPSDPSTDQTDTPWENPFAPAPEEPLVHEKPADAGESVSLSASVTGVQPMTGIVLWNTSGSRTKSYVQLEFSYMLYSDVCKKKDVFDWSVVDNLLSEVAARGHQAVLRFRYTYPGKKCAVPDYIKKWPGYEATNEKCEGRDTEFPDWRCEELQRFHKEFHMHFAERYDQDPRLAFVETGFGLWAEYHIYDGPFIIGQTFPSMAFQSEFLPLMDKWFKCTPWMISIDAADDKYAPFSSKKSLLNLKFGNFDDSFMCKAWDNENYPNWKFFGQDRYNKAPFGGEFSYYTSSDQAHALDPEGMHGRVFEDQVAKTHMTFIIGNDQPGKQTEARIREAAMSMGYRFEIRDFCVNEGVCASVLIANVGVAPIYKDAFVSVDGVRGSFSLRYLMPGESTWIQISCPATKASKPTIECDHLVPGQKIEYQASVK